MKPVQIITGARGGGGGNDQEIAEIIISEPRFINYVYGAMLYSVRLDFSLTLVNVNVFHHVLLVCGSKLYERSNDSGKKKKGGGGCESWKRWHTG
jgi:hypothetical protein